MAHFDVIKHNPIRSIAISDQERKVRKANPELAKIKHRILTNRGEVITDKGRFKYYGFKFCGAKPWTIDYTGQGWQRSKIKRDMIF